MLNNKNIKLKKTFNNYLQTQKLYSNQQKYKLTSDYLV